MVFQPLLELMDYRPLNGWFIAISLVIILSLMLWVSYYDVINQSIQFKKLIIAGFTSIFLPFLYSFISENGWKQTLAYGLSIVIYFAILALNLVFNHDRFVGKADIDIVAAPLSLMIGATIWQILDNTGPALSMNLYYIWFNFLLYFGAGLIIGTVVFLGWYTIQVAMGKTKFSLLFYGTRIPAVPTLIVGVVMTSYTLMLI